MKVSTHMISIFYAIGTEGVATYSVANSVGVELIFSSIKASNQWQPSDKAQ